MKINYIAYFDPFQYSGGGEMIMRRAIEDGRMRGHEILLSSVRPGMRDLHDNPDLTIFADVFNFPGTLKSLGAIRHFSLSFLQKITQQSKFIHLNNAYVDICNLGYLPCSGEASTICQKKSWTRIGRNIAALEFGTTCFSTQHYVRQLFENSSLNVFLSPLHRDVTLNILKLDKFVPSYVMKPVIDGSMFYNMKIDRDIDYLFVGAIGEAKGLATMREQFSDKNIVLIGKAVPGAKIDFGRHLGQVAYDEIPKYMNHAKNFVFLPRWPEPQGRVVIEAALCGCNLITNENVGATSFPFNIANINNFNNATTELWEEIERLIH